MGNSPLVELPVISGSCHEENPHISSPHLLYMLAAHDNTFFLGVALTRVSPQWNDFRDEAGGTESFI